MAFRHGAFLELPRNLCRMWVDSRIRGTNLVVRRACQADSKAQWTAPFAGL